MNKAELVAAVAEKTALSKKDSEKAVNAAFEARLPRRRFPSSRPVRL